MTVVEGVTMLGVYVRFLHFAGVPREVKNHEYRVAITPAGVHELARNGIGGVGAPGAT